jgi:hypothetical protein
MIHKKIPFWIFAVLLFTAAAAVGTVYAASLGDRMNIWLETEYGSPEELQDLKLSSKITDTSGAIWNVCTAFAEETRQNAVSDGVKPGAAIRLCADIGFEKMGEEKSYVYGWYDYGEEDPAGSYTIGVTPDMENLFAGIEKPGLYPLADYTDQLGFAAGIPEGTHSIRSFDGAVCPWIKADCPKDYRFQMLGEEGRVPSLVIEDLFREEFHVISAGDWLYFTLPNISLQREKETVGESGWDYEGTTGILRIRRETEGSLMWEQTENLYPLTVGGEQSRVVYDLYEQPESGLLILIVSEAGQLFLHFYDPAAHVQVKPLLVCDLGELQPSAVRLMFQQDLVNYAVMGDDSSVRIVGTCRVPEEGRAVALESYMLKSEDTYVDSPSAMLYTDHSLYAVGQDGSDAGTCAYDIYKFKSGGLAYCGRLWQEGFQDLSLGYIRRSWDARTLRLDSAVK